MKASSPGYIVKERFLLVFLQLAYDPLVFPDSFPVPWLLSLLFESPVCCEFAQGAPQQDRQVLPGLSADTTWGGKVPL